MKIGSHTIYSLRRFFAILLIDLFLFNFALLLSIFLLCRFNISSIYIPILLVHFLFSNLFFHIFSFAAHLPYEMWEFTSVKEAIGMTKIMIFVKLLMIPFYYFLYESLSFSISLFITSLFVTIPLLLTPRILFRIAWESKRIRTSRNSMVSNGKESEHSNGHSFPKKQKRILIIGAGSAGEMIAREIEIHPELNYQIIGFLDDNPSKHNTILRGNRVFGSVLHIQEIVNTLHIDEVLIAIPSATGNMTRKILSTLSSTRVVVRTLPGIWEMVGGLVDVSSIRRIKVEDLLEREPVETNLGEISGYLKDKVILVTGSGGSIGAELTRQLSKYSPKLIIMLGRGENRIFAIDHEMRDTLHFSRVLPMIADIRDVDKMMWLFSTFKPDIVFHAAAHKHVPLMELSPDEAFTNNILGSWNLLKAAGANHAKLFITISTDKAVNPVNVMGASKRVVELLTKSYNGMNQMVCANVRFGNVLGSDGSVLQVFQRQLADNRTIQVTDPLMERYFMLIPEAVELVLQTGAMTKGDELFVLKMGKQVNILEFAKSFIKLSGLELGKDAKIEITGNRGNEKLSEELYYEGSTIETTTNPWIIKILSQPVLMDIQQVITGSPLYQKGVSALSSIQIKEEIYRLLQTDPK